MADGVGHTGGLTNPRPWRRRCRAGYSNTGGPPLPRKREPLKKVLKILRAYQKCFKNIPFLGLTRTRYFIGHIFMKLTCTMYKSTSYISRTHEKRPNLLYRRPNFWMKFEIFWSNFRTIWEVGLLVRLWDPLNSQLDQGGSESEIIMRLIDEKERRS